MINKYFLPKDYIENKVAYTHELNQSGKEYWDERRIKNALLYQHYVYSTALRFFKEKKFEQIADVGCGPGEKLFRIHKNLPNLKIIGIDQPLAIDYCKKHHKFGKWLNDDFEKPKLSLQVDAAICSDVIEHLLNPDILLSYLKSIVKPGGYIILSTPDRDTLHGIKCKKPKNKHHIREWNFVELKNYILSHNFEITKHFKSFPVKFSFTKLFYMEIIQRLLKMKSLRYNQVMIIRNES